MRAIGLVLIAVVLFVGWRAVHQAGNPTPLLACPDGTVRVRCAPGQTGAASADSVQAEADQGQDAGPLANATAPTSHSPGCHTIDEGYLDENSVFGSRDASHVHVSYWTPGRGDEKERDVILDGGRWRRNAGVGGYFWVYADCAAADVERQVKLHQQRRIAELGNRHGGWGADAYFTRVS